MLRDRYIGVAGARQQFAVGIKTEPKIIHDIGRLAADQSRALVKLRACADTLAAAVNADDREIILHRARQCEVVGARGAEANHGKSIHRARDVGWPTGGSVLHGTVGVAARVQPTRDSSAIGQARDGVGFKPRDR